jgi:flavin reductase (DIM6/NTAB) family NADH-FMN oxidoreductase RutF
MVTGSARERDSRKRKDLPTERELRSCLSHFATGVTIVTYEVEGQPSGATVNSFTSVSLNPPLVLVCLHKNAKAARLLRNRSFTVNVLAATQKDHALHFSGRPQPHLDLRFHETPSGLRLDHCIAYINCDPWRIYDAGDHIIVLGRVSDIEMAGEEPLLFYRGEFRAIGGLLFDSGGPSDALADEALRPLVSAGSGGHQWSDDGYDVLLHRSW